MLQRAEPQTSGEFSQERPLVRIIKATIHSSQLSLRMFDRLKDSFIVPDVDFILRKKTDYKQWLTGWKKSRRTDAYIWNPVKPMA